jgi:drug/metabolite transporter (DMT)-like permease
MRRIAMYAGSIAIIVFSNILYNVAQKAMPARINPFTALLAAYMTAAVLTVILLFVFKPDEGIIQSFKAVHWQSIGLGTAIVGLEFGFLMAFRSGGNISQVALVSTIILAMALIVIGLVFYKESFTAIKAFGVFLCALGLIFINK